MQPIIEFVRDNAIFQNIMSNVKETYFIQDSVHGLSHNERVTLMACYLGIKEGLNDNELENLLYAALYHDIGRKVIPKGTRGIGESHGFESARILEENSDELLPNKNKEDIKVIKSLCMAHSVNDDKIEEKLKDNGIILDTKVLKLINILKDADALDRVRLLHSGIDEKYLRTETSKNMIEFSRILYKGYKKIEKARESRLEEKLAPILFDGENYYLFRSINKVDIENLESKDGMYPKTYTHGEYSLQDVSEHSRATTSSKSKFISMSSDPNVVLTYDRDKLHRFVLIKLNKDEVIDSKNVFSSGDYLLEEMEHQVDNYLRNAPEEVKQIIRDVDNAKSIKKIRELINGADKKVSTSLIDSEQQYLSNKQQLEQAKIIAKCKVLNYYGLMQNIDESLGKMGAIEKYTGTMRVAYHNSEWLYAEKIDSEKIIDIPQILIDSLALIKQAEFQGKDKEKLKILEQEILKLAISGAKVNQDNYQLEYSVHENLRNDLTIDRAYEMTQGKISYRDTNMQLTAIRSIAEMTLNKRKILKLLQQRLPNIDIESLLENTYCVNQEMITRQNNKGAQIGKNINFEISAYGYSLDNEISMRILKSVESLTDEQLSNIISKGIDAPEINDLLIKTREDNERIDSFKTKTLESKYMSEAIVEGYNWKQTGNSLTKQEKVLVANKLLINITKDNELYKLYDAINKIQVNGHKFSQNEIFAIMINLAIDGKIGDISYGDLIKKNIKDIQFTLLDNKESLQTEVLPISIDLLVGRGRETNKIKNELIKLGVDKELVGKVHVKNIYVARKIIEEYFDKSELSDKYKKALYQEILDSSIVQGEYFNLINVIMDFSRYNLDLKDIYGIIINTAINGTSKDNTEYFYSAILSNSKIRESVANEKIKTEVTNITLERAVSQTLSNQEKDELYIRFKKLGILLDNGVLFQNAYIIELILESYFKYKKIEIADLNSIKKCFFNSSTNNILISKCLQDLNDSGFNFEEMCGLLINLAVNRTNDENEVTYSNLLNNGKNIRKKIGRLKEKLPLKVDEARILEARSQNLSNEEILNIKNQLIDMGISNEFLTSIKIDNIYSAQQIVKKYFENQEIDEGIKKSLIVNLLNNSSLAGTSTPCYITSLLKGIRNCGYSYRDSCGLIINMAMGINVIGKVGYDYSRFLHNHRLIDEFKKLKNKINPKVNQTVIEKARWQSLDEKEISLMYEELEKKFGISRETLELKDERNIYMAKKIIDIYFNDEWIEDSEKGILIQCILNNSFLNKDKKVLLFPIMNQFEDLWQNPKKMAGMIINLSLGDALEATGFSYDAIIQNTNNARKKIEKYKDKIITSITPTTIMKAKIETMGTKEEKKVLSEIEKIGIEKDFIKNVKSNNLYTAYLLLEKCCKREEMSKENKKVLLKRILSCSDLGTNATSNLINIIQLLNRLGFDENEICNFLINGATNGIVINNKKYSYKDIITNAKNLHYELSKNKDEIPTQITPITILKAKSQMVSLKDIENIKQKLIENGVEKEMLDSRDEKDIYVANQIVESVFQNNIITEKSKSQIIYFILKSATLAKKNNTHIITILQNLELIGVGEIESMSFIINGAIKGKICKGCCYSDLLLCRKKSYGYITDEVLADNTKISEESLKKIGIKLERNIKSQDIAKATMELTVEGNDGSKVCEDVKADYQRLLYERINKKEGVEPSESN